MLAVIEKTRGKNNISNFLSNAKKIDKSLNLFNGCRIFVKWKKFKNMMTCCQWHAVTFFGSRDVLNIDMSWSEHFLDWNERFCLFRLNSSLPRLFINTGAKRRRKICPILLSHFVVVSGLAFIRLLGWRDQLFAIIWLTHYFPYLCHP